MSDSKRIVLRDVGSTVEALSFVEAARVLQTWDLDEPHELGAPAWFWRDCGDIDPDPTSLPTVRDGRCLDVLQKMSADLRGEEDGEGHDVYVRICMPAGDWIAEGFAGLIRTDEELPESAVEPPSKDLDNDAAREYRKFVNY